MECRADGFGRDIAGCIHKMGVALGHFQRMMAQPVCNGELRLPTTGQPRGIGMPQGMEDNTLPSVELFSPSLSTARLKDSDAALMTPPSLAGKSRALIGPLGKSHRVMTTSSVMTAYRERPLLDSAI